MTETENTQPAQVSTQETVTETQNQSVSPFGRESWSENLPELKIAPTIEQPTTAATVETKTEPEEEILEPKEWLKREFNIEDAAILKAEREELKRLKETPPTPAEIKFENEQSKQIHELIRDGKLKEVKAFLDKQEQLEQYTSAEVNATTADNILKLQMKLRYPTLSDTQIEFQFNEDYGVGRKPVQKTDELDDEYNERLSVWNEQVERVNMKKTIAATMAMPELQKLKAEIKLPELTKPEPKVQEPSQESLEAMKKAREHFLAKLNSDYSKVEGFSTRVKDESVEIPISFKIPDEDKVAIKGMLEKGEFDVEDYFNKRWFDEKLNPNVEKIFYDKYVLENLDKILSSVANNSASKRLEEYLKATKNLNVVTSTFTNQPSFSTNGNGQVSPFAKDAWSEKPPIVQN